MTPQLHLEFGILRFLSVPFFLWAGKKKNTTPATSHLFDTTKPTRFCPGAPESRDPKEYSSPRSRCPCGREPYPRVGFRWKKPCENPGVVELVKHLAGGVPTIDINLVGWNGKGFVWFLGWWGWRSWRSWRWRVPCWGRIWLNKLNSISIHTAPRKHPKIDPVISQQSHWWNRFLHSATPRYGWNLKPQEHGTTNGSNIILSPTEQICPKISHHKLVAQYNRYNQSTPFQP